MASVNRQAGTPLTQANANRLMPLICSAIRDANAGPTTSAPLSTRLHRVPRGLGELRHLQRRAGPEVDDVRLVPDLVGRDAAVAAPVGRAVVRHHARVT